MFFLFGTSSSELQTATVTATCGTCHTTGPHLISTYGTYAHLFYLPLFPLSRKGYTRCVHCLATYDTNAMPPELRPVYNQQERDTKTPVWQWLGLGVFGVLMLYGVGLALLGPDNKDPNDPLQRGSVVSSGHRKSGFRTYSEHVADEKRDRVAAVSAGSDKPSLAANPKVGDVYVFRQQVSDGQISRSYFTIRSVSANAVRVQWDVYGHNLATKEGALLSSEEREFSKRDLLDLERSSGINITRK